MSTKEEVLQNAMTELKIRGFSPLTARNYGFFINKFFIKTDKNPEDMNEQDVKNYLSEMFDTKSKNTIMLAAASLKFLYTEVLKKTFADVKMPKKDKKLPEVLDRNEVGKLIEATDTDKSRLIISLLYSSGLRVSELVNLKTADITLDQKSGWVRRGKGAKDRIFFLSEQLSTDLKQYLEGKEHQFVFSKDKPLTTRNIQKIIQGARKRAGIQRRVTPHTLRHSFATHLMDNGTDIRLIQSLLGHSSLNTTQVYTHISSEQLRKIQNPFDMLLAQQKVDEQAKQTQ